uniref:Uncharacterized protein n=1 Tax=Anguilla anguilla TaxID=7936 RepID=A0A0E9X0S8_ANGAN
MCFQSSLQSLATIVPELKMVPEYMLISATVQQPTSAVYISSAWAGLVGSTLALPCPSADIKPRASGSVLPSTKFETFLGSLCSWASPSLIAISGLSIICCCSPEFSSSESALPGSGEKGGVLS